MASSQTQGQKNLTPAMRQYHEWKARYPDCLLFFRMGDFYEMFYDDAILASKVLEIALTNRSKDDNVPMCGVPHHAVSTYVNRLISQGHKVAICEQLDAPSQGQKVFRREVTQVVTPGVNFDPEGLEARSGNYLMAIAPGAEKLGISYADATTGEFWATEIRGPRAASDGQQVPAALLDEIARVAPREILYPRQHTPWLAALKERYPVGFYSAIDDVRYSQRNGIEALEKILGSFDPAPFARLPYALAAAGAVAYYLTETVLTAQGESRLPHIRPPQLYGHGEYMVLDEYALAHLEISRTIIDKSRRGSLLGTIDQTSTSMGGRLLGRWLTAPLTDQAAIVRRQDAIEELVLDPTAREVFMEKLSGAYDLERLNGKVATGSATPRDLVALRATLERIPELAALLKTRSAPALVALANALSDPVLAEVYQKLASALVDEPPITLKEGGVFRTGYSKELDELVSLSRDGKNLIARIEEKEQKRTGIASLKVRYNRVFGYYIEVTRANLEKVPKDYERRQTLANAERFVTPELKEYESKVLSADEKRIALEQELFTALRNEVAAASASLGSAAQALAELDCYIALAEVAHRWDYVRPEVGRGTTLEIKDGRHPVVERLVSSGSYVPNDISMDPSGAQLLIITGPNMAGKSTVMRQVALICLMAQAGSFVPAREARLPILDRIFTRVGAADNLAKGASTFMVEMWETKNILENATPQSLILLDEIGRGTSTFDGLSIAWSVAEYIHDRIGALTLFATHYHELTDLAQIKSRVRNFHVAVREWEDQIIFLRKLLPGGANRSYGIHVAQLAGLPEQVIARAKEILSNLEAHEIDVDGQPALARARRKYRAQADRRQIPLFAGQEPEEGELPEAAPPAPPRAAPDPLAEELAKITPDAMTPLEALNTLSRLKGMLKK